MSIEESAGSATGKVAVLELTGDGLEAPEHIVGEVGVVTVEKPHLTMEIEFVEPVREIEPELTAFPPTGKNSPDSSVPEGHLRIDGVLYEIKDARDLSECPHCGSDKVAAVDDPPKCYGCDTTLEAEA